MNNSTSIFCLLFSLISVLGVAQGDSGLKNTFDDLSFSSDTLFMEKGSVRFIEDERISTFNEYLKSYPPMHSGYRIQLVFGSKATVQSARGKYSSRYNLRVYETYLAPNFRLRVGDFMTRLQAEKALSELKRGFPSAYIVKDKIEVPPEFR